MINQFIPLPYASNIFILKAKVHISGWAGVKEIRTTLCFSLKCCSCFFLCKQRLFKELSCWFCTDSSFWSRKCCESKMMLKFPLWWQRQLWSDAVLLEVKLWWIKAGKNKKSLSLNNTMMLVRRFTLTGYKFGEKWQKRENMIYTNLLGALHFFFRQIILQMSVIYIPARESAHI